ncbi:hypothetical protein GS896_27720 [Rhodococcus hoagii]|nr:hypothetical protein [Prescottella equi]MBM4654042.1 hypothetical protein [Prescottella equi]MBM4719695.1 hypothetical protein [Prescottella equi]NKR23492.1 hypothetical protein [Prescottella equi]NKT56354.1 hypothetical protein [Prescottella equi]
MNWQEYRRRRPADPTRVAVAREQMIVAEGEFERTGQVPEWARDLASV